MDRGSALILDADSRLRLSYVRILGPKRNLDHRSFFSHGGNVNEFILIISFFDRTKLIYTQVRDGCCNCTQLLYCVIVIKRVAFFTFGRNGHTCTSFPLILYTSVFGCGCGFGFKQKFWQIEGFGEKKALIGGFACPYSATSKRNRASRVKACSSKSARVEEE